MSFATSSTGGRMELDGLFKQGPVGLLATAIVSAGGGGLFAWLRAKAQARPEMAEVGVRAMQVAFEQVRAELQRMEERDKQFVEEMAAFKAQSAAERERLRDAIRLMEGYAAQLAAYARALEERQAEIGLDPIPPARFGADLARLMREPISMWARSDPPSGRP